MERRSFPLTLRTSDGVSRRIVGHAAVYDSDSEEMGFFAPFRERIARGAFDDALKRVSDGQDIVYALLNHDENLIISSTADRTLELSTDERGLLASMEPMDTPTINDLVVTPIRQGKLRKMSFGFTVADEHSEKRAGVDYRIIDRVGRLYDVSPVTFPAYTDTDIASRLRFGESELALRFDMVNRKVDRLIAALAPELRATWDASYINDLSDSAFAYIESGGEKDADGRTTPRSLRHFPHHDAAGSLDEAHVRNALARIPQSDISVEAKASALTHCQHHAEAMGMEMEEDSLAGRLSTAGRKVVLPVVVRTLPAGAGSVLLRELELHLSDLDIYERIPRP